MDKAEHLRLARALHATDSVSLGEWWSDTCILLRTERGKRDAPLRLMLECRRPGSCKTNACGEYGPDCGDCTHVKPTWTTSLPMLTEAMVSRQITGPWYPATLTEEPLPESEPGYWAALPGKRLRLGPESGEAPGWQGVQQRYADAARDLVGADRWAMGPLQTSKADQSPVRRIAAFRADVLVAVMMPVNIGGAVKAAWHPEASGTEVVPDAHTG